MAMRGPLRRELGKYRRGRPGMIPGSSGFRGGRHYAAGAVPGTYPTDLYMWGVPRDYHPNMNSPAAQSGEYVTDPEWESHHVPFSREDRVLRPFPPTEPREPDFDYDNAQAHSEFFLKAMEAQYRPLADGQEAPTLADIWQEHMMEQSEPQLVSEEPPEALSGLDSLPEQTQKDPPELWEIVDTLSHLQKVFPEDHPDIVNLRAAAHEILEHPERLPQLEDFGIESTESKLGLGNPYAADLFGELEPEQRVDPKPDALGYGLDEGPSVPADEYGGLEALLGMPEVAFDGPDGPEQVIEADDPFEVPLNEMGMPDAGPDVMDADLGVPGLVADTDNFGPMMPEDEIHQAIDGVMRQPGPLDLDEEPDPFGMQYDPFAAAQQIFDQQMQYMDNPFMMPGMGPMPGPAPGM